MVIYGRSTCVEEKHFLFFPEIVDVTVERMFGPMIPCYGEEREEKRERKEKGMGWCREKREKDGRTSGRTQCSPLFSSFCFRIIISNQGKSIHANLDSKKCEKSDTHSIQTVTQETEKERDI